MGRAAAGFMNEAAGTAIVEVRGVGRTYRDGEDLRPVLRDLDLTVVEGEFLCILGPSGGGKTTLLHILAGLDGAYTGTVAVAGRELKELDDRRLSALRARAVGLVFQEARLVAGLSAWENLLLPTELVRQRAERPPAAVASRAAELLAAVGLEHRAAALPARLSGGEKQRLCLARALINEPRVLLCDEVTGNLDRESGARIIDLIGELGRELGVTVVAASHDRRLAAAADRVLHLCEGRLEAEVRREEP